jgi:hypothetical protein
MADATFRRPRELVEVDDAACARARGWALLFAAMALPYRRIFPTFAGVARRTLAEVIAENLE